MIKETQHNASESEGSTPCYGFWKTTFISEKHKLNIFLCQLQNLLKVHNCNNCI